MPWRPRSHRPIITTHQRRDYREEDAKRMQDPALAVAKQLRSTARWQRVRLCQLAEFPLCNDPYGVHAKAGRVEPATEVDHVIPLRLAPTMAYEMANLQSLCRPCHATKTARERRRWQDLGLAEGASRV